MTMRVTIAILASSCVFHLVACSGGPLTISVKTSSAQGAAIQGSVHGGQTPLAGASVYLYAANNTGYGSAATSLLNSTVLSQTPAGGKDGNGNYYVTTDSQGGFSITGDYTCPSTASQLYLYASGGNPGGGANSAIGLLAALGTCPANGTLSPSLYIIINEVSTIATAYSIAGYATDPFHVSSPANTLAQTGITNAFATVTNLETLNTGVALATAPIANGGNGTVPQSEINTLANILAACVNSTGPTSSQCATLFANAKNGSTTPADTATAAINIAHNPGANIGNLYGLQTGAGTPFLPALSAAPNDFTISVTYSGGGLNQPYFLAVDGAGRVWVTNLTGNSISAFGPTGNALFASGITTGGLNKPRGIAIDKFGDIWVTNKNNTISVFDGTGTAFAASPLSGGGLTTPFGIAIDASKNVWIANNNTATISEFLPSGSSGTWATGSPFTGGGLNYPLAVAIDAAGNVWFANDNADSISEFKSSAMAVSGAGGDTGGGLLFPGGIAVDYSGNVWATNSNSSISEFNSSGSAVSGSAGYTGGGLGTIPYGIAVDGSGNIWVVSEGPGALSEFTASGSPISGSGGYTTINLSAPVDLAIDGSGNVWVTESGNVSITQFVGVATPLVTPMVANLLSPYGAHAVNKP